MGQLINGQSAEKHVKISFVDVSCVRLGSAQLKVLSYIDCINKNSWT